MEQLTKNQAVATSQEAVQNQNEPQLRDENAHNDKSVHGVLNPTYQAGLRRDAVQPDIEAERKKRDEIEAGKSYCSRRFGGATCDDKSAQPFFVLFGAVVYSVINIKLGEHIVALCQFIHYLLSNRYKLITNVRSSLMAVNIHITIIEHNALHTKRQNLFQALDAVINLHMEAKLCGLRKSRNATRLNSRFKSHDTLKVKIISVTFRRVIRTNHKKASKIWRHENIQLGGCQS